MITVDFHGHTTYSDGTLTPLELRALMRDLGVRYFSITDHDAVGANREMLLSPQAGMHFVTGIELTTRYQQKTLHLLAYGFDPENHELAGFLMRQRLARRKRAEDILRLLNLDLVKEKKKPISLKTILALEIEWPITRPDIAKYLIKIEYAKDFREAFDKWLRKYDVPLDSADIYETIELVQGIGGVPVLAHAFAPYISINTLTPDIEKQIELLAHFRKKWLAWVELIYGPDTEMREVLPLRLAIAETVGLLVTGGSDFHGGDKTSTTLPGIELPRVYLEKFLEKVS